MTFLVMATALNGQGRALISNGEGERQGLDVPVKMYDERDSMQVDMILVVIIILVLDSRPHKLAII